MLIWRGALYLIATLAAAILPVSAATARVPVPRLATGTYAGTISDPDGEPDIYTATIRIDTAALTPGRRAAIVSYRVATNSDTGMPPLYCRGVLTFRSRRGARFVFHEAIRGGGRSQCISGGTVTLTRKNNRTFKYQWSKRGVKRATPTGTLRKRNT